MLTLDGLHLDVGHEVGWIVCGCVSGEILLTHQRVSLLRINPCLSDRNGRLSCHVVYYGATRRV